jgi:hypothetical protein
MNQPKTAPRVHLFLVLICILFLVGCAKHFLTFMTGPTCLEFDAVEYWERGGRVARGDILQLQGAVQYRGPIYSWLIGLCRFLSPSHGLILLSITQHVLSIASEVAVAVICWEVFRSKHAVVTGYALATCCVTAPWYANVVLTEILFQFLFTMAVWMLLRYHWRPSVGNAIGFGAFLAFATLTRPIPKLIWIPLLTMFLCHSFQYWTLATQPLRRMVLHMLIAGLSLSVVLLPWSIRNQFFLENSAVAKVPPINKWVVCFHGMSGGNLRIPRSPSGDAIRQILPAIDQDVSLRQDGYTVIRKLSESGLTTEEVDALISEICKDAILEQPTTFIWQTVKRLGNFWRCTVKEYPFYSSYCSTDLPGLEPLTGEQSWRQESIAAWYEILLHNSLFSKLRFVELYSLLSFLGVACLYYRTRTRLVAISLLVIFLYFSGVTAALEIENYRYRMVLEPCMTIAIVGLLLSFENLSSRSPKSGLHLSRAFREFVSDQT